MVINLRVSRDFIRWPANDLANLCDDVQDGLTTNPAFPSAPATPAMLGTLNATLRSAITAANAGGPQQTAAKNQAYAAVVQALRKDASYVEIQADNDEVILLSSGFEIVSTNRAQSPLDQPTAQLFNEASTQLLLRVSSILNARSYQVQIATALNGPWTEAGIYTQARRIMLPGLTPGTVYFVRVRAVGGSTGYSEWSMTASLMST